MLLRKSIGEYFFDKLQMKRLLYSADKKAREVGERLAKGGARLSRDDKRELVAGRHEHSDWHYLKHDWGV